MSDKPKQWRAAYASIFQDVSVVAAYQHRPLYPLETFTVLASLIPPTVMWRTILDAGCGTGFIARPLAPLVDHPEGGEALERYLTGLLPELPNKNRDTMAQSVPGTREQRWQACLTNMPWDEEDLNRQRGHKLIAEATRGDGVWLFDDPGFPKRGTYGWSSSHS